MVGRAHFTSPSDSRLLAALSAAFAYPASGLEATTEALRALGPDAVGAHAGPISRALDAAACFDSPTAVQLAYTRLFIGSMHMEAPPYASYYLGQERTLFGQAAVQVESVYRQFGLELSPEETAPPDHLRYLLAFLALLARRWEETGEGAFAEAYADFRDEFVLTWIGECATLVKRYAEEPYYPALLTLIIDVVSPRIGKV